jgi:GNAT superfamily N-acetyltransferase
VPEARRSPGRRPRLRTREIRATDDPLFEQAYALLHRVFPRAELLPKRDWLTVLGEREQGLWTDIDWHLLVAMRGDRVIGAASGSYLGNVNVGIVGYIAVDPEARAQGLGPNLRRRLRQAFERDALRVRRRGLRAIIGEVEPDNPWLRHLVRRHDAIPLDFPYQQPSLGAGQKPVPLVLYWEPITHRPRWLTATQVRKLLYTLWRRTYRIAAPLKDPAFRRMLKALEDRKRIGARDLPPARAARRHA